MIRLSTAGSKTSLMARSASFHSGEAAFCSGRELGTVGAATGAATGAGVDGGGGVAVGAGVLGSLFDATSGRGIEVSDSAGVFSAATAGSDEKTENCAGSWKPWGSLSPHDRDSDRDRDRDRVRVKNEVVQSLFLTMGTTFLLKKVVTCLIASENGLQIHQITRDFHKTFGFRLGAELFEADPPAGSCRGNQRPDVVTGSRLEGLKKHAAVVLCCMPHPVCKGVRLVLKALEEKKSFRCSWQRGRLGCEQGAFESASACAKGFSHGFGCFHIGEGGISLILG